MTKNTPPFYWISQKNHLKVLMFSLLFLVGCVKPEEQPNVVDHKFDESFDNNDKSSWVFSLIDSTNYVQATYENQSYVIKYIGDFTNGVEIETNFDIIDKSSQSIILNVQFSENVVENNYKFHTRNKLVSVAETQLAVNTLSPNDFESLSDNLDNFILNLRSSSDDKYFDRFEFKGFNFSYSIVKMMNRAIQSKSTSCNCNTPGIYFDEESAFLCTQDIILKSNAVESFYYHLDTVVFKNEQYGVEPFLLDTLSKISQTYITYEELSQIIATLPNGSNGTDPTSSAILGLCGLFGVQGGDIGCCGNYGGSCFHCNMICIAHDLLCVCCDSGAVPCGSGCQTEAGC